MKFISWNLRNFGRSKSDVNNVNRRFSAGFRAFGLGNNTLDYVVKVATGDPAWDNIESTKPADVFMIIEAKSGGSGDGRNPAQARGAAAFGSCDVAIPRVVNAMNTAVTARNLHGDYNYTYVALQIVGYHETVAVIYNQTALTYVNSGVLNNAVNVSQFPDRSPFWARFTAINAPETPQLNMVGVHASPPNAGNAGDCNGLRYQPPVVYNRQLVTTTAAAMDNAFFMGDFNCDPAYYYTNGMNVRQYPFNNLVGFATAIPNGTLSSVRGAITGGPPYTPPTYLNDALDNGIGNIIEATEPTEAVLNLIGNARDMNTIGNPNVFATNRLLVFNAYQILSDHLPVSLEFDEQ